MRRGALLAMALLGAAAPLAAVTVPTPGPGHQCADHEVLLVDGSITVSPSRVKAGCQICVDFSMLPGKGYTDYTYLVGISTEALGCAWNPGGTVGQDLLVSNLGINVLQSPGGTLSCSNGRTRNNPAKCAEFTISSVEGGCLMLTIPASYPSGNYYIKVATSQHSYTCLQNGQPIVAHDTECLLITVDNSLPNCTPVPTPVPTGIQNVADSSGGRSNSVGICVLSPTVTPTWSVTPTRSPSGTYSPSPTLTPTPSPTATPTPFTNTYTASITATPTRNTYTATPTNTPPNSSTTTPTQSPTLTATPTPFTNTYTASITATPTRNTYTATPTNTPPNSPTETATLTATPSQTLTATPFTNTYTASITATPTRNTYTATPTNSPPFSPSASPTPTSTPSQTPSATSSPTISETATSSASPWPSATATASLSFTSTATLTGTPTASATFTATRSITATPTYDSPTYTATPSVTRTLTATPTESLTYTDSATPTASATVTSTRTLTATPTANSPTATPTPSEPNTLTASPTQSMSPSATWTASATRTATSSATTSPSATETPTSSLTPSATLTVTPSDTYTATKTATSSATASATATASSSFTASPTASDSATASATPSVTPSATESLTYTITPTYSATPIPEPYHVQLWVYNSAGERVRTLYDGTSQARPSGLSLSFDPSNPNQPVSVSVDGLISQITAVPVGWDGENDNGQWVGNGVYYFKLEAVDAFGQVSAITASVPVFGAQGADSLSLYSSSGERVASLDLPSLPGGLVDFSIVGKAAGAASLDPLTGQPQVTLNLDLVDGQGGHHAYTWHGQGEQGQLLQSGVYMIKLESFESGRSIEIKSESISLLAAPGSAAQLAAEQAVLAQNPLQALGAPQGGALIDLRYAPGSWGFGKAGLYNLAGELIAQASDPSLSGRLLMRLPGLASGIYLVVFEAEEQGHVLARKVLKAVLIQ